MQKVSSFIFLLFLSCSTQAVSETPVGSPSALLVQTLMGLIVVIGAIFLLAWVAKKLKLAGVDQQGKLKVLSMIPLGAREKAVLIEVAGQQLLLGVAPGRVTALHTLPAPDVPEDLARANVTKNAQSHLEHKQVGKSSQDLERKNERTEEVKATPDVSSETPSAQLSKSISRLDEPHQATLLAARTTSEFSRKLHSFLGQGLRRP